MLMSVCLAGIYYLPFQAGVMLYFRFSGQSIPNRYQPLTLSSHGNRLHHSLSFSRKDFDRFGLLLDAHMCKAGFNSTTGAVHGGVQTQAPCIHALEKDEPAPFTAHVSSPS